MTHCGLMSLVFYGLLLVLVAQCVGVHGSSRGQSKLVYSPQPEIGICASSVTVHGYKCEEHEVTTSDGYILNMQRIPEGRGVGAKNGYTNRPPVLIQHGVLVDGMTWLLNPPEENLPLILADKGFDVWIANTRGTRFSRKHVSLDPSQSDFWNWSWDELVTFDLPTFFDHVYSQTNQKAHYVGHSLGTLIALASFSEGRLENRLQSAALLSPIAYLSHMKTALGVVAAKAFVGEATTLFGMSEFNPKGEEVARFLKSLCSYPGIDCYDYLTAFTAVRDGVVAKFNYGIPDYNLMHYGKIKPPVYNLSNIPHDLPIFVSYGGQDSLSDIKDVQLLLDAFRLHDADKLSIQYIKEYAHADFIMGVNAKDLVFNQVASFFNRESSIA